jgi:predicted RNA-binding protein (virulence factor B family)
MNDTTTPLNDGGLQLGRFNRMRVVKEVDFGDYLDGGEEYGEVLLPLRVVPKGLKPGDEVDVFFYLDSEDRPITTTVAPLAQVGDFAALTVVEVTEFGAFLEWGVPGKDLLLPFREQTRPLTQGQRIVVHVTLDPKQGRIVASMRLNKFTAERWGDLKPWQEVDLLVCRPTDIGYPCIINNSVMGLLYANEVFEPLEEGDTRKGYIKAFRDDDKIDLTLHKLGYQKVEDSLDPILATLKARGGFIAVTDKSSPEVIYQMFGISKKTYKKSVGALYRERLISIDADGIRLL